MDAQGLVALPQGFSLTVQRRFAEREVQIDLSAEALTAFYPEELGEPAFKRKKAAHERLEAIGKELRRKCETSLTQAEAALRSLVDLGLRPSEVRWIGSPEESRAQFLTFPKELTAAAALELTQQRRRELLSKTAKARGAFLSKKLESLPQTSLNGRNLHRTYSETMPLLASSLELPVEIEKALDHREFDRLIDEDEAKLNAAVDAALASTRKALIARIESQLRELSRRIQTLPHIELLNDHEIAQTVAPYYGGLNRALKKRRAKSALVAVEELAREAKYKGDVIKLNEQRAAYADVAAYYPLARSLKRELVLYVGPTNSGKTWRALNELAEAETGVYLAPLRLLALEGQEELEKRGKPCSFLTGEERDLRPDARFTSSTIEMLNLESQVDAVVIDEVQLLADERRGWAWLAAFMGAPAQKVIMTGSPDCIQIVTDLANYLGEPLRIHELQRYNELTVADKPIVLKDIRPGTAVVCFSRRDVLRLKTRIEESTEHKVAVVYGNLSPQVRREEARRFRSGEAQVLVATDAIAMGLNLPILEVVFYTTEKFNGEEMTSLSIPDVRQIGGRAGRYGFAQFGVVHALDQKNLDYIREAMAVTPEMLKPPFYVAPGRNHVQIISTVLDTDSLERILTFFDRAIEFSDDRFARSNIDDLSYLSTFVDERLPFLPVTERLTIASAPVGIRNETVVHWFLNRMLPSFRDPEGEYDDDVDELDEFFAAADRFEHESARHQLELRDAEDYLKALTVYAWLAYRYPQIFTRIEDCEDRRERVNAFVERSLRGLAERRCQSCNAKLPAHLTFNICDACHAKGSGTAKKGRRGGRRKKK